MMLEGVGPSFTYKWPGGEVRLTPGQPIELPHDRALRLLLKVPGRVRVVDPISWISGGIRQEGRVEDIHVTEDGVAWAYVIIGERWAWVNLKYASGQEPGR